MIEINDDNFKTALTDAKLPVLLFFKSTFCGPSAFFAPMIEKAIEDFDGQVIIAPIDIEACPKLAREMQVKGTPTALVLNLGVPLASKLGTMSYRQFTDFIRDSICKSPA